MPSREEIALLMWQVLIATAHERRTITYGDLSDTVGYGSTRIGEILNCIKRYCVSNGLPPLTVLVVFVSGNDAGRPNSEGCGVPREWIDYRRMEVFSHSWFKERPPTLDELR